MSNNYCFTGERKGISLFLAGVFIFSLLQPVIAAPVFSSDPVDSRVGLSAGDVLNPAYVAAQDLNQYFDLDGVIVVNDMEDHFLPDDTTGDALLQTRLFPVGQTGTRQGLYAYLYTVDLRNLKSSALPAACVNQINIPFGTLVPMDYDLDDIPEDYFIIGLGGAPGSVAPSSVTQDPETGWLTIEFTNPVCSGSEENVGESSYFVGFAASTPYMDESGQVSLAPVGVDLIVDMRVPAAGAASDCFQLEDPSGIPSPALINFDTLANSTQILSSYNGSYGATFTGEVYTDNITFPFSARSEPNVAYAPTFVANPTIQFSFASPVSHVGFYAGNISESAVNAGVTIKDGTGGVLCTISVSLPAGNMNTFIGIYQPSKMIAQVEIDYDSTEPEIIDDLMFSPGSGGARTEFPASSVPLSAGGTKITVHQSDNTRFAATFNLPDPSLWMAEQEGIDKPRLRFGLPGSEINSNREGYPDVPVVMRLIAIPEGSTPSIDLNKISVLARDQFLADLYPSQPFPVDADEFDDPPYTIDTDAYLVNTNYPAVPAVVYPVGKIRDLNLALLVVAGGQYNPVSRHLSIFKSVAVEVAFEGGSGYFLPDYSNNPFEAAIHKQYTEVLNGAILGNHLAANPGRSCLGHELIIITHPDFREAADTLAAWKIEKGISTVVVERSTPDGDRPEQIKQMIKNQYDTCDIRPSYVLIIDDSEFIGAFFHPYYDINSPNRNAYSDIDYALMTPGDSFPDLAYGRIPVDTLEQANIVVNKIIAFESEPPNQDSFYDTVILASFFECCQKSEAGKAWDARSFVETSETVHAALLASCKEVNRIYNTNLDLSVTKPAYYNNGALLPADIGYSSGFAWEGNTTDVIDPFNNGSSLIMHRDHGGWIGWHNPTFLYTQS